MKNLPLVSFCISTYKRPKFLKSTIEAILRQKYNNLEIIISEDPSENTSEEVVKSFKLKNIIYHKNKTSLGMVKSFNKAFSLSKGEFVSILADDDPPTEDMLEIFEKTLKAYPDMKAFFGASYVDITTKKIEKVTDLKLGLNSLVNKNKKYGTVEILKPEMFFKSFLKMELFPHYLWNASLISRDLVERIKGVPDYDSAHFIDYAYLLKIASQTNFVVINKELGIFALHELSYGKKKDTLEEYKRGVIEFDRIISPLADKLGCSREYQKFVTDIVIMFLINRLEHYRIHKYNVEPNSLFQVYDDLSKDLTFFNKRRNETYLKLNFYSLYKFLNIIRETYGNIKMQMKKLQIAT